jgi:hypothetical protein
VLLRKTNQFFVFLSFRYLLTVIDSRKPCFAIIKSVSVKKNRNLRFKFTTFCMNPNFCVKCLILGVWVWVLLCGDLQNLIVLSFANIHDFRNHFTRRLADPRRRGNERVASFDNRKERFGLRRLDAYKLLSRLLTNHSLGFVDSIYSSRWNLYYHPRTI